MFTRVSIYTFLLIVETVGLAAWVKTPAKIYPKSHDVSNLNPFNKNSYNLRWYSQARICTKYTAVVLSVPCKSKMFVLQSHISPLLGRVKAFMKRLDKTVDSLRASRWCCQHLLSSRAESAERVEVKPQRHKPEAV